VQTYNDRENEQKCQRFNKIERGQRNANLEQAVKLAEFFKIMETDLLVSWLSDKLVYEVANENMALKA